jgi:hypothetical protein
MYYYEILKYYNNNIIVLRSIIILLLDELSSGGRNVGGKTTREVKNPPFFLSVGYRHACMMVRRWNIEMRLQDTSKFHSQQ